MYPSDRSGVYLIINMVTARVYVGSTSHSTRKRWAAHRCQLRKGKHHCSRLQRAWDKYGEAAFEFRLIEALSDPVSILEREQVWLDHYLAGDGCYNTSRVTGTVRGIKRSAETRQRMSESARRSHSTPEYRAGQSAHSKARMTPEYRANMARGAAALWQSEGHRARISAAVSQTRNTRRASFLSPDGTLYLRVSNHRAFCATHDLPHTPFHRLLRGERSSVRGWTLLSGMFDVNLERLVSPFAPLGGGVQQGLAGRIARVQAP